MDLPARPLITMDLPDRPLITMDLPAHPPMAEVGATPPTVLPLVAVARPLTAAPLLHLTSVPCTVAELRSTQLPPPLQSCPPCRPPTTPHMRPGTNNGTTHMAKGPRIPSDRGPNLLMHRGLNPLMDMGLNPLMARGPNPLMARGLNLLIARGINLLLGRDQSPTTLDRRLLGPLQGRRPRNLA